jgi:hypothetical protein
MGETVYVVGRRDGGRVFHTERDCRYLDVDHKVQERDRDRLEGEYRECKACAGTEPGATPTFDHYNALKAAAEGDG